MTLAVLDGDGASGGLPLTGLVARRLVLQCFSKQHQWTRKDLIAAVDNLHRQAGGASGTQATWLVVKKTLSFLRADGAVLRVGYGIWRLQSVLETSVPTSDDVYEEDENELLEVREIIGDGDESLYVYYNSNDFRLAECEGRNVWECKIGHTAGSIDERILSQGVRTALSHLPVVGLVIKTGDAHALEGILHRSLRLVGGAVDDSPGNEWFMTSPNIIKAWYENYVQALKQLDVSRSQKQAGTSDAKCGNDG